LKGSFCNLNQDFSKKTLLINKAHKIPKLSLKIQKIIFKNPSLKILLASSKKLKLENFKYKTIYPLTARELLGEKGILDIRKSDMENTLVFGLYPKLREMGTKEEKILFLEKVLNSVVEEKEGLEVLKFLALKICRAFSLEEICFKTGLEERKVKNFLKFFEDVFLVKKVGSYGNFTKNSKYYFFDNGIRNVALSNFDNEKLLENHILAERIKGPKHRSGVRVAFFGGIGRGRGTVYIEEEGKYLEAFEIKKEDFRISQDWIWKWVQTCQYAGFQVVDENSFPGFIHREVLVDRASGYVL